MSAGMISSVAATVATRLLASGIQRAGSLSLQKAMRISRVEHLLKSGAQRSQNVKLATDDFETLIGNRYGQYNEKMADFLQELERGGLITAMVEDALLNRSSKEIKKAFLLLHSRAFAPDEGNAEELFERLTISFSTTFREVSKDKIVSDTLKLMFRELSNKCDQIDHALQAINNGLTVHQQTPLPELQGRLLRIARGLQAATKQVRVETNKGPRSVDISKIYIPPKLRHRDTKRNAETLAKVASVVRPRGRVVAKPDSPEPEWRIDPSVLQTISYGDLKLSFSRVVILGDPGGGKSTICQNLCFDLAKQAATALGSATENKPTAQLQKFPIRVVLRTFEKARTVDPQLSLFEFIARDLKNYVSLEWEELEDALAYLLASGAAVLAFDGLDEILATAQRREFVDLVIAFCNQYPLCPTLVTSRLVGYDDAPLSEDFEELILERFDQNEILNYLIKFFKVVGGRSHDESGQFAQDFLRQTASNASDLRTNPLMLGLMAWLFNARGDVPSNRPEIYRECAILMFERWDPDRDIKADVPADFDKLHLFSTLASRIFGDPELAAGVESRWLSEKIREYLEALYENKAQAAAGTKAIVKFITGRAWVMTDVGDGIFAFTHQTFLEYFFARHVDEKADTVGEVLGEILPHIMRNEWDVVAHLSLQIKTHRSLRRQNQAIDQLIGYLKQSRPADEQRALATFAARSLEYLIASESQIKLLVEAIFSEAARNTDGDQFLVAVRHCALCSAERRQFVRALLLDLIVRAVKKGQEPGLENIVKSLSSSRVRGEEGPTLPSDLRHMARDSLRRIIIERAASERFFASVAWSWFGLINEDLIRKHGIDTFFNAELEQSHYGVDGLTSIVLSGTSRFSAGIDLEPEASAPMLSMIGRVGFAGPALHRSKFKKPFVGATPPTSVWRHLLRNYRKDPEALAGAFFIFLLVTSLAEPPAELNEVPLESVRSEVLNSKALKKLDLYPKIVEAASTSVLTD